MNRKFSSRASNLNAAIWLIGLGILWLTGLWWPGILILVGVSMLVQALVRNQAGDEPEVITTTTAPLSDEPKAPAEPANPDVWADEKAETPSFIEKDQLKGNPAVLPEKCPACGGPIGENAHKVVWMGEHTARCPFCDTVINV